MKTKINNCIRKFFALVLTISIISSFNSIAVFADEGIENHEIDEVSLYTEEGGNWAYVQYAPPNNYKNQTIVPVYLQEGKTYNLYVTLRGVNSNPTGSVNLQISGFPYGDIFNKNIPVDGTPRAFTITARLTGLNNIFLGTLPGYDFAYAIRIMP